MNEKLMTASQEREYHASHPTIKRPNRFAKDGFVVHNTDHYSKMKSVMAQVTYKIEEKKRVAREEKAKKRADKKKGTTESEVVS